MTWSVAPGFRRCGTQLIIFFLVLPRVAAGQGPAHAPAWGAHEKGWLNVVWTEDPRPGRALRYFLHSEAGADQEVGLDAVTAARLAPALARGEVRIEATLDPFPVGSVKAHPIRRARRVRLLQAEAPRRALAASVESRPFGMLLCRYPDDPAPGITPAQGAQLLSASYPGAGHFFNELSDGQVDLAGSRVFGWYTLPQPSSVYLGTPDVPYLDLVALTKDCLAAAAAELTLTDYFGFVIQVNGRLPVGGQAGSWTVLTDGVPRVYKLVWMSGTDAPNQGALDHEIGHTFGWPHSSGPYGLTYDSGWDIMSHIGMYFDPDFSPTYKWLGVHTIAWHKYLSGWIPESRVWRPGAGAPTSILLVRSALPPAGPGYQVAFLPLASAPAEFYSVELRLKANSGYDRGLPEAAEGVLIHQVVPSRGDRVAQVVDADSNGYVNDQGATWNITEAFIDRPNNVYIRVDSVTAAGYWIYVGAPPPPPPPPPTPTVACAVQQLVTGACLPRATRDYLDQKGNANGTYDIGDLLAFLDREGLSLSTAGPPEDR